MGFTADCQVYCPISGQRWQFSVDSNSDCATAEQARAQIAEALPQTFARMIDEGQAQTPLSFVDLQFDVLAVHRRDGAFHGHQ